MVTETPVTNTLATAVHRDGQGLIPLVRWPVVAVGPERHARIGIRDVANHPPQSRECCRYDNPVTNTLPLRSTAMEVGQSKRFLAV